MGGGEAFAGFVTVGGGAESKSFLIKYSREECARHGVQGPAQGPLVGYRSKTLAGVHGAEPLEAPGFLGFLRPQNAIFSQVLLQNQLTILIYAIR